MAKLLLGKEVTDALNASLQTRTAALREKGTVPTLGIIRVGANPSDLSYEKGAVKRAELVGVEVKKFELPESLTMTHDNYAVHGNIVVFKPFGKTDKSCRSLNG